MRPVPGAACGGAEVRRDVDEWTTRAYITDDARMTLRAIRAGECESAPYIPCTPGHIVMANHTPCIPTLQTCINFIVIFWH